MGHSDVTGAIVPAWIRERIREAEEHWPFLMLTLGLLVAVTCSGVAGICLWSAPAVVCYARP